ncbi:MAG: tRNA epoxyqueuosine(34) reductase QueG [Bacteroidales bacterium]
MKEQISRAIKEKALELGFDAIGIAPAAPVSEDIRLSFDKWISQKGHAGMSYMENYYDKRMDPRLLTDDAKSVIVVALNYYPEKKQNPEQPQISYYAYGEDYHEVIKEKLQTLYTYINNEITPVNGRCFVDTAPILERYWATRAGIGFIGKSNLLIIPKKGTFFFLGLLIVDKEMAYDQPLERSCGNCTRCIDHCPTKALSPYYLDSHKCISYLTIENREEIPAALASKFGKQLYGCDICQQVCPWNRFATPTETAAFTPKEIIYKIDNRIMESMQQADFSSCFKGSPVKRTKFAGLKRNWECIRSNFHSPE